MDVRHVLQDLDLGHVMKALIDSIQVYGFLVDADRLLKIAEGLVNARELGEHDDVADVPLSVVVEYLIAQVFESADGIDVFGVGALDSGAVEFELEGVVGFDAGAEEFERGRAFGTRARCAQAQEEQGGDARQA